MKLLKCILLLFIIFTVLVFTSCLSNTSIETLIPEAVYQESHVSITGNPIKSSTQLFLFFMEQNPSANEDKVLLMSKLYVEECAIEGINSDVAFVQMCLETGFLRFGGLVTEDMNNFCGLGAIDENQRGNSFSTVQEGIRAHVQHLKGYGTDAPLVQECIDPRYKWINPKGKAPTIYGLAGTWAADKAYGEKLYALIQRLGWF